MDKLNCPVFRSAPLAKWPRQVEVRRGPCAKAEEPRGIDDSTLATKADAHHEAGPGTADS
jgi:hypothetical protein